MNIAKTNSIENERRWTTGSFTAATFALFIILYSLVYGLYTVTLPTDGWITSGSLITDPPELIFAQNFLGNETPIQAKDQLLAINGKSGQEIINARYPFFRMEPPDLPDGTILEYTIQRGKYQIIKIDVPVRRVSFWEYFRLFAIAGTSNYVMMATGLFLFLVSLVVFLLRPGSRAAHALLVMGATFFTTFIPGNMSAPTLLFAQTPPSIPFDGWTLGILPSLMYLVLVFPYPKPFLLKHPKVAVALLYLTWPVAFNTAFLLNLDNARGYIKAAFTIYPIEIALTMIVTVIAFIHTARNVKDPVGRSQFKWMLAGISSFLFIGIGGWLVSAYIFPETMINGNWLFTTIGWFLLPVCMAIGITRYRLFDIDVIIRKTLVYALLTGLLGLVYFGSVALIQGVLTTDGRLPTAESAVSSQPSAVVIVGTTLAIAALFNPLRRRLQDFIDRRFYRQKYDAEKALADFAAAARSETDLSQLANQLTSTVQETMQPIHVGLWLETRKIAPPGGHSEGAAKGLVADLLTRQP